MHLVDDINAVPSYLRQNAHLVYQSPDVIHAIVGSGIQFMDIQRTPVIKRLARFTLVTRLGIRLQVHAINCLGKNTGTRRFPDTTRSTEQIGLRQLFIEDRISQRGCDRVLPDHGIETCRSVFTRRNNIILHE